MQLRIFKTLVGVAVLLAAATARADGRLIATGWDSPSAARFRAELGEFEKWGVFDGTTIAPTRRLPDGKVVDTRNAFSREHWEWSEFAECVRDLKGAQPRQATNNFLFLYANPGNVDWFDDAGWREVVDHWRLLARAARAGGLRGLLYDAEPYTPPHSQFLYRAQPQKDRHTFAEYREQARERGRQVMRAVAEEFPGIVIMTYRLACDLLPALESGNLQTALEVDTYGLHPAFVDGWCDVMPASVRIVEGDENAYRFNSAADFNRAFASLRLSAPHFVSPENQRKFAAQLLIGHGLYLDAHVNPPSSPWYVDRLGASFAQRFGVNTRSALDASDGFVWVYGEQGRWWPGGAQKYSLWPDKMPGLIPALLRAKDPRAFALSLLKSASPSDNLLGDPSLSETNASQLPQAWWTWQDEKSHGRFRVENGAACLAGMDNGVLGQSIPVKPGETLAVGVRLRSSGRGYASLGIGWKTADGKWTAHHLRRSFSAGTSDAGDWQPIAGLVEVPSEAGQLIFMLAVQGQFTDADRAWFDDAQLVRLPE